jgi:deoxyribonuclease-4
VEAVVITMGALFGPAGNSESFKKKYKSFADVPGYLREMGLDVYEYQCGHGVTIGEASARKLGELARENGVLLTLHAPYFISLSSPEEETREKSIGHILKAAQAAAWMGAGRMVVHAGSCGKMPRERALALAKDTLARGQKALEEAGLSHIILCPEVMGKLGQLGTLEEVLALCKVDERFLPCVDFGHLNARTQGWLCQPGAVKQVFDAMEDALGQERASRFHSHFSKIEYTSGGEKRHLTFADTMYGPDFAPVAEETARRGWSPVFICESAGTQAEDAQEMKGMYQRCCQPLEKP